MGPAHFRGSTARMGAAPKFRAAEGPWEWGGVAPDKEEGRGLLKELRGHGYGIVSSEPGGYALASDVPGGCLGPGLLRGPARCALGAPRPPAQVRACFPGEPRGFEPRPAALASTGP